MGGNDAFEKKLDELFIADSKLTGRDDGDISGMIGQYVHGNEPSHGIIYLYNHVGRPWKTQERLKQIMNDFYKASPDGIIGNEDCGQMSAWYVLNAIGLYQDCPGNSRFLVCATTFPEAKINLENGKSFTILNPNKDRTYYDPLYIDYAAILKGGAYTVAQQPTKEEFAKMDHHKSYANATNSPTSFASVPIILASGQSFRDSTLITMEAYKAPTIYYSAEGQTHSYQKPFYIYEGTTLKAWAAYKETGPGRTSRGVTARFYKMPHPERKIKLLTTFDSEYPGGGDEALIDGIKGEQDWKKGSWQGYQGKNLECVVDLGARKNIKSCSAEFLQDEGSWIMLPREVEFSFSDDGINFSDDCIAKNEIPDDLKKWESPRSPMQDVIIKQFIGNLKSSQSARYVKVQAINYGKLPNLGIEERGNAWIFADEISIE